MIAAFGPLSTTLSFCCWHWAWGAALTFAAFGAGAIFLTWIRTASWIEKLVYSLGLGFAAQSAYVFLLGLLHLLTRPWLLAGLVVDWMCALFVLGRAFRSRKEAAPWQGRALCIVVGVVALALAVPVVLQPLYPPSDSDATAYHLAVAKVYLQQGKLLATPYLRYPVFPQFMEMLFTLALGVADDVTAHLISFVMWLGTALALVVWGRREGSRYGGWLAAGLWLGGPTGLMLGGNAFLDAGLAFYATLAIVCWSTLAADGRTRWAVLTGLFAGCAAGIKYTGLFFVAVLAVATWLHAPQGRRWSLAGTLLAAAAVPCVPWLVRNAVLSGDPFFPFLGSVFPNRFWSADDLARQLADFSSYSLGRSAYAYLRVWDRLAFDQGLFVGPEDVLSPALWIPLPVLLAARWRHARERAMLLVALVFCTGWFFFCPSGRYLMPILPVLCFGMGQVVAGAVEAIARRLALRAAALASLTALLFALPGSWYALDLTRSRGGPPMTPAQRDAFLAETYPSYPAYVWLNRTGGTRWRVYGWRDSPLAYYADGQFMGDWFGPARYAQVETSLTDAAKLHRALRALHADYFLVPDRLGPVHIPADGPFPTLFTLVYSGPGARVYQLAPGPAAIDSEASRQR